MTTPRRPARPAPLQAAARLARLPPPTVAEPGTAQVCDVEPGAPEFRAAAALTSVEPVRSELRLCRFIGPGGNRVGRIVGCCHSPDDSADPGRSASGNVGTPWMKNPPLTAHSCTTAQNQ